MKITKKRLKQIIAEEIEYLHMGRRMKFILMVMWIVNVNYNHHGYYSTDGE